LESLPILGNKIIYDYMKISCFFLVWSF